MYLFIPVLLLTAFASLFSLLSTDFYFRDSEIMAVKCHYLDLIHMSLIVPSGAVALILANRGSKRARLFILGIMAYLGFMFGFNALSLFFNELFLVYIAVFGLNIFGIILGYGELRQTGSFEKKGATMNISGAILMFFALSVSGLWLMEIIGATINDTTPDRISGYNIPVSVTHVFDLSFALPAMFIGAILLLKGRRTGLIISSIMAVFVLFVCIGLLGMELGLQHQNFTGDVGQYYYSLVMSPISLIPMILLYRKINDLTV